MCNLHLNRLRFGKLAYPSFNQRVGTRPFVLKTRRQRLLDNEAKLVSSPPPKGDPSWIWYEESPPNGSKDLTELTDTPDDEWVEEPDEVSRQRGSPEIEFAKFGVKMTEIPTLLKELVTKKLKGAPKEKIREDALRIFASNRSLNEVTAPAAESVGNKVRYGHKRPPLEYEKPHALSYGPKETLAYLAAVMPSSYATLHRVLSEIKLRDSKFKPSRILDFGTGPGTSLWAVDEVWGLEGLEAFHGVDLSESMLDVANEFIRTLFTRKENPNCQLRLDQHFSYMPGEDSYDLVIASNVFSEYPNDTLRQKALEALWERCGNTLALVERGTPRGFHIVNQARELLKMCESHIMGPCAQDMGCPLAKASKFCHFQQQLQRPRFLMEVKDSKSNQEFANYSYLILRKGPRPALPMSFADDASYQLGTFHWGRIVDKPNKRGGHIKIKLCSPNGVLLEDVTFTKAQGGSIYRDARKATWGDLFPHRGKAPSLTNLPSQFKKDSA